MAEYYKRQEEIYKKQEEARLNRSIGLGELQLQMFLNGKRDKCNICHNWGRAEFFMLGKI